MKYSLNLGLFVLLSFGMLQVVVSQETPIANGTFEFCGGFLVDTGLSAADYGANEDITMTLCPEAPEVIITLYFALASLGPGDVIEIYDGDDTSGTLLGTYVDYEAQGLEIFATTSNPTGCLTVHFTSDAEGNGNFVAEMSCGYPCERPFAIVSTGDEEVPVLACVGEEIEFDATFSTSAQDFEISTYLWDFIDGETSGEGPVVTHTFEEPGAYNVQLDIWDNNITEEDPDGCGNHNMIDHLILVSTEPDWSGTSTNATICAGQVFPLDGVVTGVTYDAAPSVDFGGGLYIPDDQTQCFNSELTFTSFAPGAVIEDANFDIQSFFINFEHSYMGDLTISFICPNGQSMTVHEQGGNGTYLGEPIDGDAGENPGVGYDYWWSPLATNGTWEGESAAVTTLPSDTYSATSPWTLLDGCPLNGTWEIEICDSWAIDNGFVFDWAINFDPALFPDPIVFTPVFGQECDSTSWAGEAIFSQSADCNEIEIQPTTVGELTYTYTATNNFGCTYEADVIIDVVAGPELEVSEPIDFCGQDIVLSGTVTNAEAGLNYTYNWAPAEFVDGTNGATVNLDEDELTELTNFFLTVNVTGGDLDDCSVTESVWVDVLTPPVGFEPTDVEICLGDDAALTIPNQPDGWDQYTYVWSGQVIDPFTGDTLWQEISENPAYGTGEAGDYEVVISMPAPCTWEATGSYTVVTELCAITIPNVFSPNNDGHNDAFIVEGLGSYALSTMQVFNRWGNMVWEHHDFGNSAGWRPALKDAPEGTYYFVLGVARETSDIVAIDETGNNTYSGEGMYYFHGDITLLR